MKTNKKLDALAAEHIARPPGRPPAGGYEYTVELGPYQIDTWNHAQRLILVVVDQPDPKTGQLILMPRWFFLVTNWPEESRSADELLAHYRKRGTFEDRLGEFNESIGVHLPSQGFKENEATMLLALLAFNLNTICRNELAYILWPRMYVIHAGDSRCYVQRDGELSQLTKDHTVGVRPTSVMGWCVAMHSLTHATADGRGLSGLARRPR